MRPRLAATIIVAATALMLLPQSAAADFQTLYDDYHSDGVIDGCAYSTAELSAGLNEIPADVREYDPGFSDAINGALEQRAAGCGATAQAAPARNEVRAADGSPGPAPPQRLVFATAGGGRGMPAVLVALIVVLAAALGAAGMLAAVRHRGRRRSRSKN